MDATQRKALQSILLCRTEAMGGRRYRCGHCQKDHFAWHSCNHRLCPVCGGAGTAAWVAAKLEERLRVDHYMITFTLPAQLREACLRDPAASYKHFFAFAAKAIKDVLKQPRHLSGQCGFYGMLQTWRQDMGLHPHIHFIIPAVALGSHGRLNYPRRRGWLARGDVFAARLRTLLSTALVRENILPRQQLEGLRTIKWNCDVAHFGDGANAIKYIGAYLHKGPICDSRILEADERSVTIAVKDRTTGKTRPLMIEGADFVRRYLQHALPHGFHRLRYFGFLHPRARATLAAIRARLGGPVRKHLPPAEPAEPPVLLCPHCRRPMVLIGHRSRAPPHQRVIHRLWNRKPRVAA